MSRHYDDDGLCRHCRRLPTDAHRVDCPLTPDRPLPDDPPFDPYLCDRAEDDYLAMRTGEPRRYP